MIIFRTAVVFREIRLICDFGRRLGRYNASRLAVEIRQFQTQRAFQTVANEVAIVYDSVLLNQALERVAKDSVRRAPRRTIDWCVRGPPTATPRWPK